MDFSLIGASMSMLINEHVCFKLHRLAGSILKTRPSSATFCPHPGGGFLQVFLWCIWVWGSVSNLSSPAFCDSDLEEKMVKDEEEPVIPVHSRSCQVNTTWMWLHMTSYGPHSSSNMCRHGLFVRHIFLYTKFVVCLFDAKICLMLYSYHPWSYYFCGFLPPYKYKFFLSAFSVSLP